MFEERKDIPGLGLMTFMSWVMVIYLSKKDKHKFDRYYENILSNISVMQVQRMTASKKSLDKFGTNGYSDEPSDLVTNNDEYKILLFGYEGCEFKTVKNILENSYKISEKIIIAQKPKY